MRKRPIILALSVAGIIAGTHAGIAAINSEGSENVANPAAMQTEPQGEPQDVAEAQAPAESQATVAQSAAESVVQPKWMLSRATEPQRDAANIRSDEYYVRVPFTNIRLKVTNPTFPSTGAEHAEPLPAVVAYFDRRNANIVLTGAPSPVFPSGSSEFSEPLPAVAAYFDRMDAQRLASVRPAPVATAQSAAPVVATDSPVTAMSSAADAHLNTIDSATRANQLPGT